MGILYRGNVQFDDIDEPRYKKNEWGTDICERTLSGAKTLLPAYRATLRQGQNFNGHFLQTWDDDGGRVFPKLSLVYKGFITGLPDADGQNDVSTKSATKSASVTDAALAKQIKGKALDAGESTVVECVREVTFYAPQTTWRYILNSKPNGASYNSLNSNMEAGLLRSSITCRAGGKERVFNSLAPANVVSACYMPKVSKVISHSANHVIGTPYWECSDVVSREFIGDNG